MPRPSPFALLLGVLLASLLLTACSDGSDDEDEGGGQEGASTTLAPGTCWTGDELGADPQDVLGMARDYGVSYFDAAHAVAGRPAFRLTRGCGAEHEVEVYKTFGVDRVQPVVTTYTTLLAASSPAYRTLAANVERACMNKALVDAVNVSQVPGAVMEPAFPEGVELGWAPPSPEQWRNGQRVYACTISSARPLRYRYAAVFTRAFPTDKRTCIDSKVLVWVDCARKHDRERIAVLDVRAAVAAGRFPGRSAIKVGPDGRFVDLKPAVYARLDQACTTYLRVVSSTRKLTGVAEIDADQWPRSDGAYPVTCEADTKPTKNPLVTQGSVFDR